jgi:hypothetical protein
MNSTGTFTARRIGERLLQRRAARPGQRAARLVDGDLERRAAARREHRDDAAERPANQRHSSRIDCGQHRQVAERRVDVVGLLLQARDEARAQVGPDRIGPGRAVGFSIAAPLGHQRGVASRGEEIGNVGKRPFLALGAGARAMVVDDQRERSGSAGARVVGLDLEVAALIKDRDVAPRAVGSDLGSRLRQHWWRRRGQTRGRAHQKFATRNHRRTAASTRVQLRPELANARP